MAKRTIVCLKKRNKKTCHYVIRSKHGQFKRWSNIRRSIDVDKRRKTKTKLKRKGYGHLGDYK